MVNKPLTNDWAHSSAWIEWLPAEQLVEGSSPSGPVLILIRVFYERIHEIEFLQKKLWELHYKQHAAGNNNNNNNNNAKLQLDCIKELRLLSVTLADLYKMLPLITGFEFESVGRGVGGIILRGDNHINWTETERKGLDHKSR